MCNSTILSHCRAFEILRVLLYTTQRSFQSFQLDSYLRAEIVLFVPVTHFFLFFRFSVFSACVLVQYVIVPKHAKMIAERIVEDRELRSSYRCTCISNFITVSCFSSFLNELSSKKCLKTIALCVDL